VSDPCPACRTRAAAEYLARGRRRELANFYWAAFFAALVGIALGICKGDPSAVFVWELRHV